MAGRSGKVSAYRRWRCIATLAALLWAGSGSPVAGQEETLTEDDGPQTEEEALDTVQEPFPYAPPAPGQEQDGPESSDREDTTDAVPAPEAWDECDPDYASPELQEDTQEFFRTVSCHSFRWFDGLFGDEVDYPEDQVNGLALLGFEWSEYEGFDPKARFKVRAPLPNWNNRWDVILGRGDDDAFISDTQTQDSTFYNPGLINRGDDDSLLLGLGHRGRGGRKGWDWSIGARLRTPPVPYVRLRYYYYKTYSETLDLRARQTFFWRSDDGFGLTSRADVAKALNEQDVLRWEGVVTASEATEGAEWFFGQTWYHLMRDRKAFSILAFATGETDAEVELKEYGLNFIWRQRFTRDWMWISYGPTVTWPRYFEDEERELSLGFGVWVEMEFGRWRY